MYITKNPKSPRYYFTQETEDAIVAYNQCVDDVERDRIYMEKIHYPFTKLVACVFNTFRSDRTYHIESYNDLQATALAVMTSKMHLYNKSKGKAYSYFSIIAKNYFILQSQIAHRDKTIKESLDVEPEDGMTVIDLLSITAYESKDESVCDDKEMVAAVQDWWRRNFDKVIVKGDSRKRRMLRVIIDSSLFDSSTHGDVDYVGKKGKIGQAAIMTKILTSPEAWHMPRYQWLKMALDCVYIISEVSTKLAAYWQQKRRLPEGEELRHYQPTRVNKFYKRRIKKHTFQQGA
jgi:hypothetical protein